MVVMFYHHYDLLSSDPVAMDTDPHDAPRIVRRRLQDHLSNISNVCDEDRLPAARGSVSSDEEESIPMDFRQIGDTYREYFV